MRGLWVVFKKEFKDAIRDRRAVLVAMLPAIFGPVAMLFILSTAADTRSEASEVVLQVRGQENAPDLIAYLEGEGIEIEPLDGDPKTLIQNKTIRVAMAIPDDFAERFRDSQTATIELFADYSLEHSDVAADRVRDALGDYNRRIASLRLMVRGLDPSVANPVRIEARDFSTRSSRAGLILNTLQLILLMAAFFGGAGVAIDTTAGERERKSWEPLLVHPVRSVEIAAGKWLTVTVFSLAACVLSVLATTMALQLFSLEAMGIDPHLTLGMQASLFALQIPLALFASGLQMVVSVFAKTFKEAQGFLGLLTLLPMLPVMITLFKEIKTATWMYLVPIVGQQQLMITVMRGEGMSTSGYALATVVTLALALVLLGILTRLLRTERVIFGS